MSRHKALPPPDDLNGFGERAWERHPNEPMGWYTKFLDFASIQPNERTLTEACARAKGEPDSVNGTYMLRAREWRWQERAGVWDIWKRRQKEAEWLQREDDMRERDWAIGEKIRQLIDNAWGGIQDEDVATPDALSKLLRLAHELQSGAIPKLQLGGPDEVKRILASLPADRAGRLRMMLLVQQDPAGNE